MLVCTARLNACYMFALRSIKTARNYADYISNGTLCAGLVVVLRFVALDSHEPYAVQ